MSNEAGTHTIATATPLSPIHLLTKLVTFISDRKAQALAAKQRSTHEVLRALLDVSLEYTFEIPGQLTRRNTQSGGVSTLAAELRMDAFETVLMAIGSGSNPIAVTESVTLMRDGSFCSAGWAEQGGNYPGVHFLPTETFMAMAKSKFDRGPDVLREFCAKLCAKRSARTGLENRIRKCMDDLLSDGHSAYSLKSENVQVAIAGASAALSTSDMEAYLDSFEQALYAHARKNALCSEAAQTFANEVFDVSQFVRDSLSGKMTEGSPRVTPREIVQMANEIRVIYSLRGGIEREITCLRVVGADFGPRLAYAALCAMKEKDPDWTHVAAILQIIVSVVRTYCQVAIVTRQELGCEVAPDVHIELESRIVEAIKTFDIRNATADGFSDGRNGLPGDMALKISAQD